MNDKIDIIKSLLIPYEYKYLQRYGGNYDGGYILSSILLDNTKIIYSYGIGPEESWITFDRHMIKLHKHVYMYDNLQNGFWTSDPYIHFKSEYVNSTNIYKHIVDNNHTEKTNMVLKMDIEGNEFETLLYCPEKIFTHFNQLAIEIHDVVNSHCEPQYLINAYNQELRWQNKIELLTLINKYYKLVHIHGNNNSSTVVEGVPDVLELLYIRNDCIFEESLLQESCPRHGLDFPNSPTVADIELNWWIK